MGQAKAIEVKPITAQDANRIIRTLHYSGKVVNNSQVHFGVFLDGKCGGALSFGPSLDKRKMIGLVEGTLWNEFLELNRMALADWLPRNGESRAISVAMRLLRRKYPWLKWVVSFADATQCGDGTIYRAAGFVLTGIKVNNQLWQAPEEGNEAGEIVTRLVATDTRRPEYYRLQAKAAELANARVYSRISLTDQTSRGQKRAALSRGDAAKGKSIVRGYTDLGGLNLQRSDDRPNGGSSMKRYIEAGFRPLPGFQLRYLYFLDPTARERLTVPIIPFAEIEKRGASMYRGQPRAGSIERDAAGFQSAESGATPTPALQPANSAKALKDAR